jgi:hypothetical protein
MQQGDVAAIRFVLSYQHLLPLQSLGSGCKVHQKNHIFTNYFLHLLEDLYNKWCNLDTCFVSRRALFLILALRQRTNHDQDAESYHQHRYEG